MIPKEKFIKNCVLNGYASKKRAAEYAESKTQLTEEDYAEVFRQNERANDVKNGAIKIVPTIDSDYLINSLGQKQPSWKRDIDLNRGLRM
jgi:hypothetical protein